MKKWWRETTGCLYQLVALFCECFPTNRDWVRPRSVICSLWYGGFWPLWPSVPQVLYLSRLNSVVWVVSTFWLCVASLSPQGGWWCLCLIVLLLSWHTVTQSLLKKSIFGSVCAASHACPDLLVTWFLFLVYACATQHSCELWLYLAFHPCWPRLCGACQAWGGHVWPSCLLRCSGPFAMGLSAFEWMDMSYRCSTSTSSCNGQYNQASVLVCT